MTERLPYRWYPIGTVDREPTVGDLIPFRHAVWRVVDIRPIPEVDWTDEDRRILDMYRPEFRAQILPHALIIRPNRLGDDPKDRNHDEHYALGGKARWSRWPVYPNEHYPICAHCGEPLPCRDQMAEKVAAASAKRMDRYEVAGVCPACSEVVTQRQKRYTWPDNLEIPGGPPVTFHARRQCRGHAAGYEKRWVAADPERRRAKLTCPGMVTNHNDGTYQCTQLNECPGPTARHPSYTVCRCPDCHARGQFGCTPNPNAKLLGSADD